MTDSVAQDQIRAFVDRILRLKEEAKDLNRDIREVYAEAKGNGFDKTVLGKLVSYVEKRANGANDLQEAEALFDLYLSAYDGASHTHAREEASEDDWQAMRQWASARIASGADEPEHDADGVIIESTAARKDVLGNEGKDEARSATDVLKSHSSPAGTQAPPVDTITEPEAAMLPQTVPLDGPVNVSAGQASVESPATSSQGVTTAASYPAGHGMLATSSAGTGGEADRQPITDLTQPNPICRDPGDCGVYASWHHPCLACKRAANVARAA